jgi:hypothetical protein
MDEDRCNQTPNLSGNDTSIYLGTVQNDQVMAAKLFRENLCEVNKCGENNDAIGRWSLLKVAQ